jgi:sugar lactone lactonase YvrE
MKKNLFLITLAVAALVACQGPKQSAEEQTSADTVATEPAGPPVTLTQRWETDTVLTTCESVLYDKDRDVLYVSNINGVPDAKDGNGFISKVSLDGKVAEVKWAKGMDAPKGMGIANGKLYVTDITRIHEIDVTTGKITKTYKVEGAAFLNDITVDASGKVYASDTGAGFIAVIENGKVSKWLENLDGPNGLLAEGQNMLTVFWNGKTLNTIDVASKQVVLKSDSIENPDGIEALGDGSYLVSSWNGMVHLVGSDNSTMSLLDTRADSVSAADIEYIQEKNLLLVPTFFKNKIVAYEVKKR